MNRQHRHRWGVPAALVCAIALVGLLGAGSRAGAQSTDGGSGGAVPHAELTPIDLTPDSVIHGGEASASLNIYVRGKATFDFNGDGLKDFFVSYWTKAFHPQLRHQHIDMVLGMETWPADANVYDLRNRVELVFPNPQSAQPDDPTYSLYTVTDINGDRKDDIVIKREDWLRERLTSVELRVYYGHEVDTSQPGRPPTIDVVADEPDFRIRQPSPPRNDTEAKSVPMPDRLDPTDLNGDGENDLIVRSCDIVGPGHTNMAKGALYAYYGPYGDNGTLDLSATQPNVTFYSSNEINVCTLNISKIDADAFNDLIFTGAKTRNRESYHYGAVVFGRGVWQATNDIETLVGTTIVNTDPDGDVDVSLKDMNGDRARDLRGDFFTYEAPEWDEGEECNWFAGADSYPATLDESACDFRFTGKTPTEVVDVNGDGQLDYIFEVEHRGTLPFQWNIGAGPIAQGGEMYVTDVPGSASWLMQMPYTSDPMSWRFGNVGGTADDDLLTFLPAERYTYPDDGQFTIKLGPITTDAIPPTPTATSPVPTATPGPVLPTVTPTPVEPNAPEIDMGVDAVIYGDEAGSGLNIMVRGKAFFDFNGDGKRDFLVNYWTRAFHPTLRHQHTDIIFGKDAWEPETMVSNLRNRLEVVFPNPADALPDDPVYKMNTNVDLNGDRKDDLVVAKTDYLRERMTAYELRAFYGYDVPFTESGRPAVIDVANDEPDFTIRQPSPPRNATEAQTVPMPDKINTADFNGDGAKDLMVSSCDLLGPGHNNQSAGALMVFYAPFGDNKVLDLSAALPDVVFYSSREINVCTANAMDLNTDALTDILLTDEVQRNRQPFHYGVAVLGREWPATVEIGDVVSTRFENSDLSGDVDVSLKDMNGDRSRDVRGQMFDYNAPSWDEGIECDWAAGKDTYPAVLDESACDMRFTGEQPQDALDINGDGILDYIFDIDQRGIDPFQWNIKLGPVPPSGDIYVTERVGSADYVMTVPYTSDTISWRWGNVGGSGDNDFLTFLPEARHAAPGDGVIDIQLGPMVEPPVVETPTPTTPPTVGPSPTATTPPPPTFTPVPEDKPFHLFLPVCKNREEPS